MSSPLSSNRPEEGPRKAAQEAAARAVWRRSARSKGGRADERARASDHVVCVCMGGGGHGRTDGRARVSDLLGPRRETTAGTRRGHAAAPHVFTKCEFMILTSEVYC